MNDKPVRVSICLPTYNGAKFLAGGIESALAQTFGDFELLISDDCSTDQSVDIIRQYAEKDARIVWWQNPQRRGLFANYNECIAKARGEFIKPFAQDDMLVAQNLEKLVKVLDENPAVSLVSVQKDIVVEGNYTQEHKEFFTHSQKLPGKKTALDLLLGFQNFVGEPSTVMFRRSFAGEGFDARLFHLGDTEYWIRLLQHGDYYYLHEPLCKFRHHTGSATSRNIRGLLIGPDYMLLGRKHKSLLGEGRMTLDEYKKRTVECMSSFLDHLTEQGLTLEDIESTHVECLGHVSPFVEIAYAALRAHAELQQRLVHQQMEKESEVAALNDRLQEVVSSKSWKITAPLRRLKRSI